MDAEEKWNYRVPWEILIRERPHCSQPHSNTAFFPGCTSDKWPQCNIGKLTFRQHIIPLRSICIFETQPLVLLFPLTTSSAKICFRKTAETSQGTRSGIFFIADREHKGNVEGVSSLCSNYQMLRDKGIMFSVWEQ